MVIFLWVIGIYTLIGIGALVFHYFDVVRHIDRKDREIGARMFVFFLWSLYLWLRAVIKNHGIGIM
ncbi:hypothetical protein [Brevibacillus porteri]|uniref:Uncharacterized protein n=1 Tax=Brevibacillus porteri TaxID=2126350 RepID=A0ABX5FNC8_9BACL|nr:hypothetical protein [Brevibacillus porteri]MED1800671.1 hypothetical protein [Brevibacillus porteri]MED2133173.1 hypothetical protein [Brevibacillus porteri]MED2746073.1 hypothetical protein [Brevibacillus porteri]MED2817352.1 hypothetical protein [Brevibacillus porteri]MED2896161.1 hypothetical protein [Brevibacillus porteri]